MRRFTALASLSALALCASASAAGGGPADQAFGTVPLTDAANAQLLGVSVARKDIWAVGYAGQATLAEHGTARTGLRSAPTPSPQPRPTASSQLEGVDSVNDHLVYAVGTTSDTATLFSRTLIERYDGHAWVLVPSPDPAGGDQPNTLHDVLALSATDVWAVGGTGDPERALILHLDAAGWHVVQNACGRELTGISGSGPADLWTVGSGSSCHYDGTRWTRVPIAPTANGQLPTLSDVAVISPTQAIGVGAEFVSMGEGGRDVSVVERWNGTRWQVDDDAPVITDWTGVTAWPDGTAWIVGGGIGTAIAVFDGHAWQLVPSPPSELGGLLNDVDASARGQVAAVGWFWQDTTHLLAVSAPSPTQGALSGTSNVGDATVSWFGAVSGSTPTDQSGNWMAAGLPAGRYTLVFQYPGCTPLQTAVTVAAGRVSHPDLQLSC